MVNQNEWINSNNPKYIALCFGLLSICISGSHITSHLRHFAIPDVQRNVIRIVFLVPVYSIASIIALFLSQGEGRIYVEVLRDLYESYVIYSFYCLILNYCGGEAHTIYRLQQHENLSNIHNSNSNLTEDISTAGTIQMPFPFCYCTPLPRDGRLIRLCFQGILQFLIIKPLMVCLDLVMLGVNQYYNPIYQLVELIVYNVSYCWAIYCLYIFYLATKHLLTSFRPILKFISVKCIILLPYYQSLFLRLIIYSKVPGNIMLWNDFLLCLEMFIFAILLYLSFPCSDFLQTKGSESNSRVVLQNAQEAFRMKDIYQNISHNFHHKYKDYALQQSPHVMMDHHDSRQQDDSHHDSLETIEIEMNSKESQSGFTFNYLLRNTQTHSSDSYSPTKLESEEPYKQSDDKQDDLQEIPLALDLQNYKEVNEDNEY